MPVSQPLNCFHIFSPKYTGGTSSNKTAEYSIELYMAYSCGSGDYRLQLSFGNGHRAQGYFKAHCGLGDIEDAFCLSRVQHAALTLLRAARGQLKHHHLSAK